MTVRAAAVLSTSTPQHTWWQTPNRVRVARCTALSPVGVPRRTPSTMKTIFLALGTKASIFPLSLGWPATQGKDVTVDHPTF